MLQGLVLNRREVPEGFFKERVDIDDLLLVLEFEFFLLFVCWGLELTAQDVAHC